jgi:hypothetical protein
VNIGASAARQSSTARYWRTFVRLFCTAVTMTTAACTATSQQHHPPTATGSTSSAASIVALSQSSLPDPPYGPNYETTGSYPQVSGVPGLEAVNAALRNMVTADQEQAREYYTKNHYQSYPGDGPGVYTTYLNESHFSISSAVVSYMIATNQRYPGGTNGQGWISVTTLVPSAKVVPLTSLFNDPTAALTAIAALSTSELVASNPLTAQAIADNGGSAPEGLTPKLANYQHFAMTPTALFIGFNAGQSGCAPCDRQLVTISWDKISSLLSPQGKLLVSELR